MNSKTSKRATRLKAKYKLGESFPCKCGRQLALDSVWLAAHWDESLVRLCSCGERYQLQSGRVRRMQ